VLELRTCIEHAPAFVQPGSLKSGHFYFGGYFKCFSGQVNLEKLTPKKTEDLDPKKPEELIILQDRFVVCLQTKATTFLVAAS